MYACLFFAVCFVVNIPVFENDLRQLFKITFPSLFNSRRLRTTHVNTNLHSFDSSKDRLDTKILSHVSLQLSVAVARSGN